MVGNIRKSFCSKVPGRPGWRPSKLARAAIPPRAGPEELVGEVAPPGLGPEELGRVCVLGPRWGKPRAPEDTAKN